MTSFSKLLVWSLRAAIWLLTKLGIITPIEDCDDHEEVSRQVQRAPVVWATAFGLLGIVAFLLSLMLAMVVA